MEMIHKRIDQLQQEKQAIEENDEDW